MLPPIKIKILFRIIPAKKSELTTYQAKQQAEDVDRAIAAEHANELAYTQDQQWVPVLANANNSDDIAHICANGADGVGLLRTEYLFQNRVDPPTFQDQYETYLYLAGQMESRQLTVRAIDLGGDKPMPYLIHSHEANPFLGLRGARPAGVGVRLHH